MLQQIQALCRFWHGSRMYQPGEWIYQRIRYEQGKGHGVSENHALARSSVCTN